jgi:hypothetical protein
MFSNISEMRASISNSPLATPEMYHSPILLDFNLTLDCHRISLMGAIYKLCR